MLLLLACQPTPDEEIVKNRLDGTLLSAVSARAAEPYQYEAPDRWTEEMEVRGQAVHIDASVEIGESMLHPVLTIQKKPFDPDTTVRLLKALFGEDLELREGGRSYDELLEDLMTAQRGCAVDYDEETGEIVYDPSQVNEDEINELKELLAKTSPYETYHALTEENLIFPGRGQVVRDADGNTWYLVCQAGCLSADRYRKGIIQPESWVMQDGGYFGEKPHALENIQISEEDAIAAGSAFLNKLNRPDLVLADTERARMIQGGTFELFGEGYSLYYISGIEGIIPVDYAKKEDSWLFDFYKLNPETAYADKWPQEDLWLFVTEKGVLSVTWENPKEIVMTANENATLLPFSEIQKSIRQYLEYGLVGDKTDPVTISRIVLSMAIQRVPNQGNEAFLAPTWIVYIRSSAEERLKATQAVFLISALDGTYISRLGWFG